MTLETVLLGSGTPAEITLDSVDRLSRFELVV